MALVGCSRASTHSNLARLLAILLQFQYSYAYPAASQESHSGPPYCRNAISNPFDYSAKPRTHYGLPLCPKDSDLASVYNSDIILRRQVTQQDDYSCSESKPCINGACCPKETGWCNYGPKACGTTNTSPNDVCWSNCDAKAECGRFADPPDKKCPLNVCCSAFGFCGMTEEFCKVTDDKDTSCQSNCKQPDSGSSGSNIRDRVIGYYEAWVHDRRCNGMSIDEIPVGVLTHLMFSFAYVSPENFQIVPMDDLQPDLFSKMTALKKKNKSLKVMVALGGWTFNDPGPTQRVFHEVAKNKSNRSKFIGNLLSFMRQYAFDGVDFDWEYPGAEDRGGEKDDGENFTTLLEELQDAIKDQPLEYVVSFTTPTSYWYLRHFDIKGSTDAVDFVNIMSYDLHGVWDAWNPIGSNVLAHTNLTEIKLALDLYWRNDIPPEKLNLGFGFYGRSFQLADPTCHKPGCKFLGGAAPGPCTKNSGTLAYREITDIIEKHKLKPYYDKKNQVKWIVWNNDQWISYDDEETIKAKIEFANDQGLGGLLIWSVDQDSDDLSALSAIVGPGKISLALKNTISDDAAYWQDVGARNCYVTDCGGSCKAGYQGLETQPCGSAKPVTRHSDDEDSTLCCPLDAMPDESKCSWRSDAPLCEGRCDNGEVLMQLNKWGDGWYCEEGHKAYCCDTALERQNNCEWRSEGEDCQNDDLPLTFQGLFRDDDDVDTDEINKLKGQSLMSAIEDYDRSDISLYCCSSEDLDRWNDCKWNGKPGSCFDGHCDINTEVQLTWSRSGGGEHCGGRFDRTRIFCCAPPDGEELFLPVPLENLFPEPPEGDDVETQFDLKVDDSWGGAESGDSDDDDPDEAAFQFYVLASPDEIQTSLDKRDGSHWELFNCKDPLSEEAQTVQMICTNDSDDSNCNKIFKGHGATGTIIQMPQGQGCGPGKYAVVKNLERAQSQDLPKHLVKRIKNGSPTVYDLTFDYDFARVPRDFGDTQLRVDFSNQEGYWDRVVEAPSRKLKKRSLTSVRGNHKRWLEEEWREDLHFGGLARGDLHKRWFGEDALDWLKGLLNIEISKEKRHDFEEELSAIILQEKWKCGNFQAKIDAIATAGISMSTSFGFTLITTLGPDMNLDKSFLHFNNEGKIEAIFTLDAVARVDWDSKVFNIVSLPIPGGTFKIPGILTVGPQLDLDARFRAGVSVHGRVEARVSLAEWEIRQTYPQQDGYEPQIEDDNKPKRVINSEDLASPQFDTSLQADGYAEAHLLPTVLFGIKFNKAYGIDDATVSLVADGWARMRLHSDIIGGDCGFGYRVEAGCSLTAKADVPDAFNWHPSPYTFGELDKQLMPKKDDKEWECLTGDKKRDMMGVGDLAPESEIGANSATHNTSKLSLIGTGLRKRLVPYGPIIKLPKFERFCPTKTGEATERDCKDIYAADALYDVTDEGDLPMKRSIDVDLEEQYWDFLGADSEVSSSYLSQIKERSSIERRDNAKRLKVCYSKQGSKKIGGETFTVLATGEGPFDILDNDESWETCNNYGFGKQSKEGKVKNKHFIDGSGAGVKEFVEYKIEHVLEANQLDGFMVVHSDLCPDMRSTGWFKFHDIGGMRQRPWNYIAKGYPSKGSNDGEFYKIIQLINHCKQHAFLGNSLPGESAMSQLVQQEATMEDAIMTMKVALLTWKYLNMDEVKRVLKAQSDRVGERLETADRFMVRNSNQGTKWEYANLKGKWNSYIKGNTARVMARLKSFLDEWVPKVEAVIPADTSQDSQVDGRETRRKKVKALKEAIDNMGTWSSPWS